MAPIGSKQHEMKKWTKHHWLVGCCSSWANPLKKYVRQRGSSSHAYCWKCNMGVSLLHWVGIKMIQGWFFRKSAANWLQYQRLLHVSLLFKCGGPATPWANLSGSCHWQIWKFKWVFNQQNASIIKNRVHHGSPTPTQKKNNLKQINNWFDFVSLKRLNMIKLSLKLPPQSIAAIAQLQAEAAEPIAANAGGTRGELQHLAAEPRPRRWGMEDLDLNVETLGKVRYFFSRSLLRYVWYAKFDEWILSRFYYSNLYQRLGFHHQNK